MRVVSSPKPLLGGLARVGDAGAQRAFEAHEHAPGLFGFGAGGGEGLLGEKAMVLEGVGNGGDADQDDDAEECERGG